MAHLADASTNKSGGTEPMTAKAAEQGCINRALRTMSEVNRSLLRASSEPEFLKEMCQVIVEHGGYRQACVGYAQHDENKSIRWMECVGIDKNLLDTLHFTWADTELGRTVTGTAIRTGKPSIGRNILTDPAYSSPNFAPFREEAIKRGYASLSAFPLSIDGEVFGALGLAAAEPDAFDQNEVHLLSELAADLAYGIGNLRMRSKHREAEATIARLAYYDTLTDLPNRTFLLELLKAAIQVAKQLRQPLALLHLEVGRFHEINKVLGYRSGDELLQELARRIAESIKENETLTRVGEAEFALLLPNGGSDYAAQTAQRLAATLHNPVEVSGLSVDASVAIGIALFPDHAITPETLLRRANAAMRNAKPIWGGYAMYAGGQEERHTRQLSLMGDLRRAIHENELLLYCQPKLAIASRKVCGAEALVRWKHPVYGMISTSEFIKLAEHAGLITPLTNWVLDAAFRQSFAWHQSGLDCALSVNLSAHDLRDPELIVRIRELFSKFPVPPESIQFELTESALMEDPASALETLTQLKSSGSKLFIDDFGTGYSSLSYLQKLPVDGIKIDQSFVIPMAENHDSAVIVHSTVELGHNLGLEVVAEGVESRAAWNLLASLGCDVAQGYLISAPVPVDQFKAWESSWSNSLTKMGAI
ncbi:GGDEF domain-containing protein [Undibacterium sp.]|jgi:diguanylate cyclase (GGDEF)-like protein|uniref:bifunctional diguanylate cyclase/phosphodiesterase n=1 Tax=Undibacterium sp. TaxID=1914977 RepID=UPI002BCB4D83|nr:GGDEF domain-containing protein [Undibacterium sp.]HTD02223.1 GGDEF domain-containing protein [Undibacterium sp.]